MALLYGPDSSKVISDHLKLPYLKSQSLLPKLSENLQLCPRMQVSKREEGDERHSEEIRRWFVSLSQEERESALSLQSSVLVSLLIQMHQQRLKSGEIELALIEKPKPMGKTELTDYFYVRNRNLLSPPYEEILRLTDSEEYLDTLTIGSPYTADPDKFFNLMKSVSRNRAFSAPCREFKTKQKRTVYEYPVWISPCSNTFNSVLQWACAALEQSLWITYWNRHRSTQKSLGYSQILPSVQAYWDGLSSDRKHVFFENINLKEIQGKLQRFEPYKINPNPVFLNQVAISRYLNNLRSEVIMNQSDSCIEALQNKGKESSFVYDLVNSSFVKAYSFIDFAARAVFMRIVQAKEEEELETLLSEVHIEHSQPVKKKKKKRRVASKVEIKKEIVPIKTSPKPEKRNIQFVSTDSEDFQLVSKKKRDKKTILNLGAMNTKLNSDLSSKRPQKYFKTRSSDLSSISDLYSNLDINKNTSLNAKPKLISNIGSNSKSNTSTMADMNSKSNSSSRPSLESKSSLNSVSVSPSNLISKQGSDLQSNLNSISGSDTKGSSDSCLGQESQRIIKQNTNLNSSIPIEEKPSSNPNLNSERISYSSLHDEIIEFYNRVSLERTRKSEAIQNLVKSFDILIKSVFPGSEVRMFGSYASGLALETSDVDLQVLNKSLDSRVMVQQMCIQLGNLLQAYSCVICATMLPQATVPVIKLEMDLHSFDPFQHGSIHVDLSFGDTHESHGGLKSLKASKDYLNAYPSLAYITIVLKAVLNTKNLNNTYLGGINSYSLLLWIVAFYKHYKVQSKDYGELLQAVLYFYGHAFDYKTQAIDPKTEDGFSSKAPSDYASTLDPINDANDTTRTGYRVQYVLYEFADAYKRVQEGGLKNLF